MIEGSGGLRIVRAVLPRSCVGWLTLEHGVGHGCYGPVLPHWHGLQQAHEERRERERKKAAHTADPGGGPEREWTDPARAGDAARTMGFRS